MLIILLPALQSFQSSITSTHLLIWELLLACLTYFFITGTFVCADICMYMLDSIGKVNIRDVVRLIRTQRANAVQTPEQYVFCHVAVLQYAQQQGLLPKNLNIPQLLQDCQWYGALKLGVIWHSPPRLTITLTNSQSKIVLHLYLVTACLLYCQPKPSEDNFCLDLGIINLIHQRWYAVIVCWSVSHGTLTYILSLSTH